MDAFNDGAGLSLFCRGCFLTVSLRSRRFFVNVLLVYRVDIAFPTSLFCLGTSGFLEFNSKFFYSIYIYMCLYFVFFRLFINDFDICWNESFHSHDVT